MARHFSLQTVFRMVPNRLLQEFFERTLIGEFAVKWDGLGEREIEPVLMALQLRPTKDLNTVEAECHNVFDLEPTDKTDLG